MSNWMDTLWTPLIIERLAQLVQVTPWLGYPKIAETLTEEFGCTFTKNSCIGKAKREGIAPRLRANPGGYRGGYTVLPAFLRPRPREKSKPPVKPTEVDIFHLDHTTCRWPTKGENPPYLYCGKPPLVDSPYCTQHSLVAFPSLRKAL